MSLSLTVDGERWRSHLLRTVRTHPGIVPVAKGNGYGLSVARLARRAQWLADHVDDTGAAVDMIAVGTYDELAEAASRYAGDLLVLTPWRPFGAALDLDGPDRRPGSCTPSAAPRTCRDLRERDPDARFVLEQLTSMLRHGMTRRDLAAAATALGSGAQRPARRGDAPPAQHHLAPRRGEPADQRRRGLRPADPHRLRLPPHRRPSWAGSRPPTRTSPSVPRIGTDLWLGDRGALSVTATVLDVHEVERGDTFGYRGRSRCPSRVTSSSSAAAPRTASASRHRPATSPSRRAPRPWPAVAWTPSASCARRSRSTASSGSSPSRPHMQASMLFVPSGARVPVRRRGHRGPGPLHRDRLRPGRHRLTRRRRSTATTSQTSPTTRSRTRQPVGARVVGDGRHEQPAEVPPGDHPAEQVAAPATPAGRASGVRRARRAAAPAARSRAGPTAPRRVPRRAGPGRRGRS